MPLICLSVYVLWFSVCLLIELHAAVPGQVPAGGGFLLLLCGWWETSPSFIISVSQQYKSPILHFTPNCQQIVSKKHYHTPSQITWNGKQFTCHGISPTCGLDLVEFGSYSCRVNGWKAKLLFSRKWLLREHIFTSTNHAPLREGLDPSSLNPKACGVIHLVIHFVPGFLLYCGTS